MGFKGRLLVATPLLGDPNFRRTVVYLLEHGDEGALGVVLNRPSQVPLGEPLPAWRSFAADPDVLFEGGPVSRTSVVAVARVGRPLPGGGFEPVVGDVGVLDLSRDADEIGAAVDDLRVFAGYSGWAGGQLEEEIDQRAWWVVDAVTDDLFTVEPTQLWSRVLARQPGPRARLALVPEEPERN